MLKEQKSELEYSKELPSVWIEIDFYRPLPADPTMRDYILKEKTTVS